MNECKIRFDIGLIQICSISKETDLIHRPDEFRDVKSVIIFRISISFVWRLTIVFYHQILNFWPSLFLILEKSRVSEAFINTLCKHSQLVRMYSITSIFILFFLIGEEINAKVFATLFERIAKVTTLNITDSNGVERSIKARFTKDYLVGNNDWGDFQTHRRLYGLITLGKCLLGYHYNFINIILLYTNCSSVKLSFIFGPLQYLLNNLSSELRARK